MATEELTLEQEVQNILNSAPAEQSNSNTNNSVQIEIETPNAETLKVTANSGD